MRLPLLLGASYAVGCALLFSFQTFFIYAPTAGAASPEALGLAGIHVGHLKTADGETLELWSAVAAPGKPTIAFFHGNAGNLTDRAATLRMFQDQGYGFVALDWRGYGNSTGRPSEHAFHDDGRALIETMIEDMHVPESAIILYGESIGTGVATTLAVEWDVAGLVLQSPYTSVADAARRQLFWVPIDLLLTERFSNIDKITRVREPVLIIHGEADTLFPIPMAESVAAAARSKVSTAYLAGVGHNDVSVLDVAPALEAFVASLGIGSPPR
jgi:fermentation-respiration switch protein FrsA (DUF1100 family)